MRMIHDRYLHKALKCLFAWSVLFDFYLQFLQTLPRRVTHKISKGYFIVADTLLLGFMPNNSFILN